MKKPEILGQRIVAKTRLFEIEELHLAFSNGEQRFFERFRPKGRDVVMAVPLLDNETLLLIREYAAGIHDYILSFPKGLSDKDESPTEAVNRELMEEVGYGANRLTPLASMMNNPGYGAAKMHIMLAEDLYEKRLPGDEPEALEVVPWPVADIKGLLLNPEFSMLASVAALHCFKYHWAQL